MNPTIDPIYQQVQQLVPHAEINPLASDAFEVIGQTIIAVAQEGGEEETIIVALFKNDADYDDLGTATLSAVNDKLAAAMIAATVK